MKRCYFLHYWNAAPRFVYMRPSSRGPKKPDTVFDKDITADELQSMQEKATSEINAISADASTRLENGDSTVEELIQKVDGVATMQVDILKSENEAKGLLDQATLEKYINEVREAAQKAKLSIARASFEASLNVAEHHAQEVFARSRLEDLPTLFDLEDDIAAQAEAFKRFGDAGFDLLQRKEQVLATIESTKSAIVQAEWERLKLNKANENAQNLESQMLDSNAVTPKLSDIEALEATVAAVEDTVRVLEQTEIARRLQPFYDTLTGTVISFTDVADRARVEFDKQSGDLAEKRRLGEEIAADLEKARAYVKELTDPAKIAEAQEHVKALEAALADNQKDVQELEGGISKELDARMVAENEERAREEEKKKQLARQQAIAARRAKKAKERARDEEASDDIPEEILAKGRKRGLMPPDIPENPYGGQESTPDIRVASGAKTPFIVPENPYGEAEEEEIAIAQPEENPEESTAKKASEDSKEKPEEGSPS